MTTKPAKKATKKSTAVPAGKVNLTRKPTKRVATPATQALLDKLNSADPTPALSEAERREQGRQFAGKMLGDIARLNNQVAFLHDQNQSHFQEISDQLIFQHECIRVLFEHAHLPMPVRQPRLVDAKIELIAPADATDEDKTLELKVAVHKKAHPVFGNVELILGVGSDASTITIDKLNPLVGQRLQESIAELKATKKLKYGQYYFVKTLLFHARPVTEDSQPVNGGAGEENGDVEQA